MASFKRISLAVLAALSTLAQAEVVSTQTFSYDGRGNLISTTNGAGQTTKYQADAAGRTVSQTDPQGRVTQYGYDALGRTVQVTRPDSKVERYDYDALDRVTTVTDARGLATRYEMNAFDETLKQTSPDTGIDSATYSADGQMLSRTNGASQAVTYRYDAAGRLIEQSHAGGPKWTFVWDAKDRLTEVKDPNATTRYTYDAEGHLTTKTQILGTLAQNVAYRWAAGDQLAGLTTPSGRKIDYQLKNGQIVGITLDGKPLLTMVAYHPNGQPQGWTWANGLNHTRIFDKADRLYRVESAGVIAKLLTFDRVGNVSKIEDLLDKTRNQTFGYDNLDRLISETSTGRNDAYQYDANGNRTQVSRNGAATAYAIDATSNKLTDISGQARSYAATGHLLSDGAKTFQYDSAERMIRATVSGTTYQYAYNALGQRVIKTGTRFVFDDAGRLLGEYKTDGALIQETVWLNDLPVATIRPDPSDAKKTIVYYVHPDHLGTPRAVSDPNGNKTLWRWESDAFGQGTANEDVDGDKKKFVYNLRFPGQYFDIETSLNYNYFRDYEAATGRYLQSDPIGISGGFNTYAYLSGNPLNKTDPLGLIDRDMHLKKDPNTGSFPTIKFIQLKEDSERSVALKDEGAKGAFNWYSHGSDERLFDRADRRGNEWNAQSAAALIRASGWQPGQAIYIWACEAGKKPPAYKRNVIPRSVAEKIAMELNTIVYAPDGFLAGHQLVGMYSIDSNRGFAWIGLGSGTMVEFDKRK